VATTTIEGPGTTLVTGSFTANIVEQGANPPEVLGVIRRNQAWRVACSWSIDGVLAPALDGTWSVQVVIEGLGSAVEFTRAPVQVPLSSAPNLPLPRNYAVNVDFPAGSVGLGGQPSVLARVGVMLTYEFPPAVGGGPGPFATFIELGPIQIYDI
jgi:hypothetical protein